MGGLSTATSGHIESLLKKVPPQNVEAEMSVLGSVLIDNEALSQVLEILNREDFYQESHRMIFAALVELYDRNLPADLVTLTDLLKDHGQLEAVGGAGYLAQLADGVPSSAHAGHYARIIKQKSLVRRLIQTATHIVAQGYQYDGEADELLDRAEAMIFDLAEHRLSASFVPIRDIIKANFKLIEQLYENQATVTGVPSGFSTLDELTNGFQKSDLIIIAGRPSMGKTALALNIAEHATIKEGLAAAIFSLEMSKEQLVQRMLCSQARIDSSRLRGGRLKEEEWPRLTKAAGDMSELKLFIDDTAAISVMEMRAKCRRLKREKGLDLVVVDYLQLMGASQGFNSREQEISDISRSLKALAKEIGVPVLALSQLNRAVENRTNRRPMMADLRESGAIEQDADVIAFIYRDEVYNSESSDKGVAEIIIAKQRNGPIGVAKLVFLNQFTRFEKLAYETLS